MASTSMLSLPAQTIIMTEGEPGEVMYIMCAGEVEITKRLILEFEDRAPRDKVMIRLKAEDGVIFGEMALIENDVRSATVKALTECKLLELSKDRFYQLIQQNPAMGIKMLWRLSQMLSQRLRKTDEEVVKLTTALAISLEG
ncbi:MAG: cyclic nucleotide-binding domain-containing protein [Deltaproteobacteria bacterium]|nr:cyclic nucleotide-binding domain-containing protein [Deltaproteobacteria bacterium]MBW1986277.1 cyclic nucleotide-binding domain-containing protein [Deltaproteobacteria bacterium]MBW2135591.1 cyclic nucleotide-binding domain-containing protein [Deltaproteobacteria bacterium]